DGVDGANADVDEHAGNHASSTVSAATPSAFRSIAMTLLPDTTLLGTQGAAERGRPRPVADEDISDDFTRKAAVLGPFALVVPAQIREVRRGLVRKEPFIKIIGRSVFEIVERARADRVLDHHSEPVVPHGPEEIEMRWVERNHMQVPV